MRLRQIAFMARHVAPVAEQLEQVFDLKVAFRDPAVEVFGLINAVMPVGGEFLEVLEPFRDDASGARYLERRGGDSGYMVILQDDNAMAHRMRLEAAGVRAVATSRGGRYVYTHFHPADCAGVLLSIDSVEVRSRLAPADERLAAGRTGLAQLRKRHQPRHILGDHPGARPAGRRRALVAAAQSPRHASRPGAGIRPGTGSDPFRAGDGPVWRRRGRHGHPRQKSHRYPGQGARRPSAFRSTARR